MKPHKYVIRLGSKEKQALREIARSGKTEARLVERAGFCCGRMTV